MRILMLHHDPEGGLGGATHMAWRAADALAARGHDVAIAGTPPVHGPDGGAAAGPYTLQAALAAATAQLAPGAALAAGCAAGGDGRRAVRQGVDLPRSVDEVEASTGWMPEVVHVTDLADPAAARRGLALADEAGALLALTPATDAVLWREAAVAGALARQADVVFALTPAERAGLVDRGVPDHRLAPLAQGPQLAGTADPAGFRARVGARGPLVLFLGRKIPSKGHQHLIAAAPALLERHATATIVVAGPEPSSSPGPRPGDAVPPLDRLHQMGALDEYAKHSALRAADLLVLPTVADAFPLVFVEAWTCGVPVVSGPFPGAHDVVRHGVDGLVVDADPAAVAHAVDELLGDPARRRRMGTAGRRRAAAELSWDAVAAGVERGYRDAARSRSRAPAATSPSDT